MPAIEHRERDRDVVRKPRRTTQMSDNEEGYYDEGANRHQTRSRSPPPTPPTRNPRPAPRSIMEDEAETTIGVSVKMMGELSFERLLRIDGQFEGTLSSKGSLIIGKKGQLTGDVKNMKEVVIEGGRIVGNIQVDKLTLRAKGSVYGNITAKIVKIEPGCNIIGTLNVNPHAPDSMNLKGELVKVKAHVPKKEKKETPKTPKTPTVKATTPKVVEKEAEEEVEEAETEEP